MGIEIYRNSGVDGNVRGHDQNGEKDSGQRKGQEKQNRQGIEKSQKRPVKVDGERDKIVSQPSVGEDIDDVVSGPVGKAEDVDGENKPNPVERSYPEIEKGFEKHEPAPDNKNAVRILCPRKEVMGLF